MKRYSGLFSRLCATVAVMSLVGCGTLGGAVSGAGEDLQKAGNWIKSN